MSSAFSLTNQKLKEFFGAAQTRDYDLSQSKQQFQKLREKIQTYSNSLKEVYNILLQIPVVLEKLYTSFVDLDSNYTYYDSIEFNDMFNIVLKTINNKGEEQQQLYRNYKTQIQFQQAAIKQQQKAYNVSRQKFDHYKTKIETLSKQFKELTESHNHYNAKTKAAKQTLDRVFNFQIQNLGKMSNAQNEYKKQLNKFKERLNRFRQNFKILSFSTYQYTIKNICMLSGKLSKPLKQIEVFITKKNKTISQNDLQDFQNVFEKIPLEKYFHSIKIDNFKNFENTFMQPTEKMIKNVSIDHQNHIQSQHNKIHIPQNFNNNLHVNPFNIQQFKQSMCTQSSNTVNKSNIKPKQRKQQPKQQKSMTKQKIKIETIDLLSL